MHIIETTQALVRIPSVNPAYDPDSPGEEHVSQWLIDWAHTHNFECEVEEVHPRRKNVIIRLKNGADHPHLLLNGHMDTVAVNDMSIPPFEAEIREDRLWGRGSTDMKGPLACMLHALLRLREQADQWKGTLTLACVVDEEVGFTGIRHFLKRKEDYDFAIVGEPTAFEVVRGCKGCLRFFIRCLGKAAHSSTPEKGASAIYAMAQAIDAAEQFFTKELSQIQHADLGKSTGSIGLIQGGSGINIVPDRCEVKIDVRCVPGQSWEQTFQKIQSIFAIDRPGIQWEYDPHPFTDTPFCLEHDHSLVQGVLQALKKDQSFTVNYSCDASKIVAAGIPCVIFGPGDIAHAHTANEFIALKDLEHGVESYVQIAKSLLTRI